MKSTFVKNNTQFIGLNPLSETHHQLLNAPVHYTYRVVAERPLPECRKAWTKRDIYRVVITCHSSNDYMAKQAINGYWIEFIKANPDYILVSKRRYTSYDSHPVSPDNKSFDGSLFSGTDF